MRGGGFVIGNLLTALSPTYTTALCARFISGLPHGAYFGVGSIVAYFGEESIVANLLAEKGKSTSAVTVMAMGMTLANLVGVSAGN